MLELLDGMGLSDKQGEYVQVARNSAESLLSLIDDILNFAKNDSGKALLEMSSFNLPELFEELNTLLATQAQRKNLDLAYIVEPSVPHSVIGDSDRLRQCNPVAGSDSDEYAAVRYIDGIQRAPDLC